MTRLLPLALVLALAAPAAARERPPQGAYANPGAVIATEIAFARLAQDKGQWAAFRATATADAVLFVPQLAYAQAWLKDRAEPAVRTTWQPHQVWSSCDGSLAVTRGAWQRGSDTGYFTTVWQRQNDGKYKWTMDQGDSLAMPLDPPEMIVAKVADCPKGPPPRPAKRAKVKQLPPLDPAQRSGQSDDGTLTYQASVAADGARRFTVTLLLGGQQVPVQMVEVQAAAAGK